MATLVLQPFEKARRRHLHERTPSMIASSKGSTARRKDPACGTCRKKCRKCDRKRPVCDRCVAKGLPCEGYPPRFEFFGVVSTSGAGSTEEDDVNSRSLASQSPHVDELSSSQSEQQSPASSRLPEHVDSHPQDLQFPLRPHSTSQPGLARLEHNPQRLLDHFARHVSEILVISVDGISNPFRDYILPLASEHDGVQHALLGLSACHMYLSGSDYSHKCMTTSLHHRVAAIRSLSILIKQEASRQLTVSEEEAVLAIVLLLVFHDICETGISLHGAHLTGASFLCSRLADASRTERSDASVFFLSTLAWLDMLRAFSGAEKLAYSPEVRRCVVDHGIHHLHGLVGCPPAIFRQMSTILESGKAYLAKEITVDQFTVVLREIEGFLLGWDPEQATYPTAQDEWRTLADVFRHACLLRVFRFPDAFAIPCTDTRIRASVGVILDACATIPRDSTFYKRLLFPLFLAAADTSLPHQIHYASWCLSEIKSSTGCQHPALTELLVKVWDQRRVAADGSVNVPWMEFTCSANLRSQHAYLFF